MVEIYLRNLILEEDGKPMFTHGEKQYELERIDVNEGNLLLVGSKKRKTTISKNDLLKTPNVIGVFDENITKNTNLKWLVLKKPSYRLFGLSKYEGIDCRRVEPIQNPWFDIGHISKLVIGLENVVEALESDERLKIHLEWVKKLREPYVLPRSKTYKTCVIE